MSDCVGLILPEQAGICQRDLFKQQLAAQAREIEELRRLVKWISDMEVEITALKEPTQAWKIWFAEARRALASKPKEEHA